MPAVGEPSPRPSSFHRRLGGAAHVPFKGQVELLVCNLSGATHTCTHHLLGQSHNSAERLSKRLNEQRCKYVRKQEKSLVFGTGKAWYDVEADEASFAKKRCEDEDGEPTNLLEWEQWAGIIERGRPESLMLFKTNSSQTNLRAPGPGAIKKTDWAAVAQRHLKGRNIVLHTDKARSYTMKVPGVLHDAVRHSKKVVMRKGKRVMLQPTYTRLSTHKLPNGKLLHTKAGSQIIDRAWRFIREHVKGNTMTPNLASTAAAVRSAQWFYWNRGKDLWIENAKMLKSNKYK